MQFIYLFFVALFNFFKFDKILNFLMKKWALITFIKSNVFITTLIILNIGAWLGFVFFIFNLLFDILDLIKNLTNPSTSSNELTSTVFSVFSALGLFKAFWDVVNLFLPFLVSFFLIMATRVGIKLHEHFSKQLTRFYNLSRIE